MPSDAVFLVGYAAVLTFAAFVLERLGRHRRGPGIARPTIAPRAARDHRASVRDAFDAGPGWPHSEIAGFPLGLAAAALMAAFVITTVSAIRHIGLLEVTVHSAVITVITVRARRVLAAARSSPASRPTLPIRDHGP